MKENSARFSLVYFLMILEDDMCEELGTLGKGDLTVNILYNQE